MKKPIALLLAVAFAAGSSNAQPGPDAGGSCDRHLLSSRPRPPPVSPRLLPKIHSLHLAYHAIFPGGSPCYWDIIHPTPQAPEQGDGQVAGQTSSFTAGTQGIVLHLTTPDPIPVIPGDPDGNTQTSSVGLFSTGLNFGPDTFFAARATFKSPNGPFAGKAWAVTLNARTGGNNDPYTETRLNMTLKFKGSAATLNAFEDGQARGSIAIPTAIYNSIVTSAQPFTLELIVNRISGDGAAILATAGATPVAFPFPLSTTFGPDSGPVISAIGPSLANCCVPAASVTVELTDFQILTHPRPLRPH